VWTADADPRGKKFTSDEECRAALAPWSAPHARQKGNVDEALDQFIRRLASVVKVYRADDINRYLVQHIGIVETVCSFDVDDGNARARAAGEAAVAKRQSGDPGASGKAVLLVRVEAPLRRLGRRGRFHRSGDRSGWKLVDESNDGVLVRASARQQSHH
jgi:hypothetical protein